MRYKIVLVLILLLGIFLRFYRIDIDPPGLYIDEASIGINAYSILANFKDEYNVSHPLWFKAFGEYKMPVYIYLTAGSMKIFGKNEFAVRFPSALFGSMSILLVYFLVKKIFMAFKIQHKHEQESAQILALISAFLLAISPWHLQFSRAGFEAIVSLFFYLLACIFTILFIQKRDFKYFALGVCFFATTLYTYDGYRILTPLTILGVMVWFLFKKYAPKKQLFTALLLFFLLSLPMLQFSLTTAGRARFSDTSAFVEFPTRSFADSIKIYPMVFVKNYISYFSSSFLFDSGDGIGRHQMPDFGGLPFWQFPFLVIGIYCLLRSEKKQKYAILFLLFAVPVSASFTRPSPHTLRSLALVIPLVVIIAFGIISFLSYPKKYAKIIALFIFCFALYEFAYYLHFYYSHYPKTNSLDFGAGYKETIGIIEKKKNNYKAIVVDTNTGFNYTYFLFYAKDTKPLFVNKNWIKPESLNGKILRIRNYHIASYGKLIETVYLKNINKDGFVNLWEQ